MPKYFDFEVALCEVKRKIWRRFLLRAESTTFLDLHEAIQDACGWKNYHLFLFMQPGSGPRRLPIAGIPNGEDRAIYGSRVPDAPKVPLTSFFSEDKSVQCRYLYDYGDHWFHEVNLLGEKEVSEVFQRRLVDGKRAFPPEDCGGITGYERFLKVVNNAKDPEGEDIEHLWGWLGNWNPERFILEEAKARFDR